MKHKTFCITVLSLAIVAACQASEPIIETATPNVISISYNAYDVTPTITAAAIDIAVQHCKDQGGLFANYRGVSVPSPFSTQEIHTFVCERRKTDDNAVITAQNQRYLDRASDATDAFIEALQQSQPTYTTCTTYGWQTNCTTY
jgi:hypothetical protein